MNEKLEYEGLETQFRDVTYIGGWIYFLEQRVVVNTFNTSIRGSILFLTIQDQRRL